MIRAIPETVTLHVPFCVVKRGGRNEMQMPDGAPMRKADNTFAKALARAFRWKRMLDPGSSPLLPNRQSQRGPHRLT